MLTISPRDSSATNGNLNYSANREVSMELKRTDILIKPNNARVLVRPFEFADSQRAFRRPHRHGRR